VKDDIICVYAYRKFSSYNPEPRVGTSSLNDRYKQMKSRNPRSNMDSEEACEMLKSEDKVTFQNHRIRN
jgi:hypothetical protein